MVFASKDLCAADNFVVSSLWIAFNGSNLGKFLSYFHNSLIRTYIRSIGKETKFCLFCHHIVLRLRLKSHFEALTE